MSRLVEFFNFFVSFSLVLVQVLAKNEVDWNIEMPGATSPGKDSYRCASFSVKNGGTSFITGFTANANASKAHHIIIQKCKHPIKQPGEIWDCRHHALCMGESHVMYAWAKNAPPTSLPEDVAFKIAQDELIVLQIHYANEFQDPDHTSVTVKISQDKPKFFAGIYLLWLNYLVIPPGKTETKGDMNCFFTQETPFHIFAYRPHAHELGRKVIGMLTDETTQNSQIIANGDPQKPQAFYPLSEIKTMKKGDNIFARCVYDSTSKKIVTRIGATAGDEMCNLYLMYYTEAENEDFVTCGSVQDQQKSRIADELMAQLTEKKPKSFEIDQNLPPLKPFYGHQLDFGAQTGDISGITYDVYGHYVILNRGNHRWDGSTFSWGNVYNGDKNSPISMDTVITLNSTGHVINSWGKDFFYLPHMITIDSENNVWITDVAMHQVFKFGPYGGKTKQPLIALGQKFEPGGDDLHYCKPTSVAVMKDARTFFVSDGYCNSRIIQYVIRNINANGYHSVAKVMSFGAKNLPNGATNPNIYNFQVPHALTLFEKQNFVCVADREHGLVQCFQISDGILAFTVNLPSNFNKVYSIDSDANYLAILGGPDSQSQSKLLIYDIESHQQIEAEKALVNNPHDVAMKDGKIIVANLNPAQIWIFENEQRQGKKIIEESLIVETPKAIVMKTKQNNDAVQLWKSLGLIFVFTTGLAMIIFYIRNRRRKLGDGFQPLKTEEDEL